MEHKRYRQISTVGSGWLVIVICLLLLFSLLRNWSGTSWAYLCWLGVVALASYLLLIRPYVLLDGDGVVVANVSTDVHIPWSQVEDVEYRWGLRFLTREGRKVNVWAIYAHHRTQRRPIYDPGGWANRATRDQVSSGKVAMIVQRTVLAYEDGIAEGRIHPDATQRLRIVRQWPLLGGFGVLLLLALANTLL